MRRAVPTARHAMGPSFAPNPPVSRIRCNACCNRTRATAFERLPSRLNSRHDGTSAPARAPHAGWATRAGRSPGSRLWRPGPPSRRRPKARSVALWSRLAAYSCGGSRGMRWTGAIRPVTAFPFHPQPEGCGDRHDAAQNTSGAQESQCGARNAGTALWLTSRRSERISTSAAGMASPRTRPPRTRSASAPHGGLPSPVI
jgi:hypothetical protein